MSEKKPPSSGRRTLFLCALAILIGAIILLLAVEWGAISGQDSTTPLDDQSSADSTGRAGFPAEAVEPNEPDERGPTAARAFASGLRVPPEALEGTRSPLADGLNDPAGNTRGDLAILENLFTHFAGEFHELPVGNNAEITAALAGDNARAYAVLPPNHPVISRTGELLDRWGSPYFFHQLSRMDMEIRSAGPDRRRYTADDVIWPEAVVDEESTTVATADFDPATNQ